MTVTCAAGRSWRTTGSLVAVSRAVTGPAIPAAPRATRVYGRPTSASNANPPSASEVTLRGGLAPSTTVIPSTGLSSAPITIPSSRSAPRGSSSIITRIGAPCSPPPAGPDGRGASPGGRSRAATGVVGAVGLGPRRQAHNAMASPATTPSTSNPSSLRDMGGEYHGGNEATRSPTVRTGPGYDAGSFQEALVKRIGLAFLAVTIAAAFGCQQDNKSVNQKLDDISQRLSSIEAKLGNAPAPGAAARPPQQARPQPVPTAVYAVPIGESAVIGSKLAKVTIIEAFTFT